MPQTCEYVIFLQRVFPLQVYVVVFALEIGQRALELKLKAVEFSERGTVTDLDVQHTSALPVELLH